MEYKEFTIYLLTYFESFKNHGYDPELNEQAIEDITAQLEIVT